ncbi:MAG TPA: hypothetical protein PK090_11110, partial [Smithellaceae bacterium]|nr:hypothetical protein [Smithellaceae bacterium]
PSRRSNNPPHSRRSLPVFIVIAPVQNISSTLYKFFPQDALSLGASQKAEVMNSRDFDKLM